MADKPPAPAAPTPAAAPTAPAAPANVPKPPPPPKPQNPALKMLGLPRMRLPSRNWSIFLGIVGSWTGALLWDRRQKRLVQEKWCKLVEHMAEQPLATTEMPRRLTIILGAPPGDGLTPIRQHFLDYVKPILVAGAVDWDVIEGRREGDIRVGVAERIRRRRRAAGEAATTPEPPPDRAGVLSANRARTGIHDPEWPRGDVIIGRHTWKEYIRGAHEGWLGSIDPPPPPPPPSPPPPAEEPSGEESKKEPEKPTRPPVAAPHIAPGDYAQAPLPPSIPEELGPACPIALPHILGFFNTPIRMWRFLTRRKVADEVGRTTAAAVLAAYRPLADGETELLLKDEERAWHKSARRTDADEGREREWTDPIVQDSRVWSRQRVFVLEPWAEREAEAIWRGSAGLPGRRPEDGEA